MKFHTFLVSIEIITQSVEEYNNGEPIKWIDITVTEKEYSKFLWWYTKKPIEKIAKYWLPDNSEVTNTWLKELHKQNIILEFPTKLDFDTFISENELAEFQSRSHLFTYVHPDAVSK